MSAPAEPFKFTIDRKVWARGLREVSNTLLGFGSKGDTREQCCVGIYCSALGVPDSDLKYNALASEVAPALPDSAKWLVQEHDEEEYGLCTTDTPVADRLYSDNDSQGLTEPEREVRIAKTFAAHNVQVEFVN